MSRDRDANHEVSGRDGDRDADFTQPRLTRGHHTMLKTLPLMPVT